MNNELKKTSVPPRLVKRIPVKKNRAVIAGVLILIMGLLWLRVFLGKKKTPSAAGASAPVTKQPDAVGGDTGPAIVYKPLPVVSGRNDKLATDMFSAGNWPECPWLQTATTPEKIPVKPVENDRTAMFREAKKLASSITLEVIISNENRPEAIVSVDGLSRKVTTGSEVLLQSSRREYSYEVTEILNNKIVVTWMGVKEILTGKKIQAWEKFDYEMTMFEP